jgi:chromosome segregation ATPase
MHLEDVNIEGFKSFSEETNMSFQPGIGVIIGNNGVGKSNILDAIVWAMGDDDLSRIRCYEQDELFFAGSKDYPPASGIRVELNLKEGEEKNAVGVRLAREMNKEGRNRYYIQGKACDWSIYKQNLDRYHLAHALKTIIRQEQINDLLQLNPLARVQSIGALLGKGENGDIIAHLQQKVDPLFKRYMSYLMPKAHVALLTPAFDGKFGIDVEVMLKGNRVRRAHQLSGGEKAVTSLALKLALFRGLESPFYLLDEVEPSLDYTNHKSMQAFLKDVASDKQLIMITHLRSTMELANTLHGVRTRWDGSSFMKFYFVMEERLLRLYKCC